MRLCYFDDFRLGAVKGDRVVDITSLVTHLPHRDNRDLIVCLIENFDALKGKIEDALATIEGTPLAQVRLRPPVPMPQKIDCMAVNYMENGLLEKAAPINGFHKTPASLIGHGDTMALPDAPAGIFEGEAELALVIGKRATNVSQADAMSHVFGYMNFIDGSARDLPPPGNVFFQAKSRDTFAPTGPFLVTADEIADPHALPVKLTVNGQVMQDFNTDDMANKIPRCIEWLSSIHTLEPGDIVATGTNHQGLNPFQDGDTVTLEVGPLGKLEFTVSDPLKRTWARVTRAGHRKSGEPGNYTPQLSGKYAK
ncbi:MAG: fumarylacetoacetate hydrolase family protein [Alphaproteobacteria bacterium]|nr:fumarylacetoacetate hydrolase family protein [Alphaproteobacteria bacterium]